MKNKKIFVTIVLLQLVLIVFIFQKIKEYNSRINKTIAKQNITDLLTQDFVLHPYIGFVNEYSSNNNNINRFGFMGPEPIFQKKDDEIIIAVFGGSVASNLYLSQKDFITKSLQQNPLYADKKIIILNFAFGGLKQPQQLMILNYFLALNAKFDIILNIDGFNEVALSYSENIPQNISSFYPRQWNTYARNSFDVSTLEQIIEIEKIKSNSKKIKHFFSKSPLNKLSFIENYLIVNNSNKIIQKELKLAELLNKSKKDYQTTGPEAYFNNSEEIEDNIISVWKQSSIQMNNVSKANGILYLHFLQPNQYFVGSKELTELEIKEAWQKDHPYKKPVEKFYNTLILEGKNLNTEGVPFTDLTLVFKDVNETIYVDNCCHYNDTGYHILAKQIIEKINSY